MLAVKPPGLFSRPTRRRPSTGMISGNPSQIYGSLQANGRVFVINPNGILAGPSGQIHTKGFVASTLDVPDASFLSGANLILSGNSGATVRNQGSIQALGGDVYLIAHNVENDGTISAPQGTVGLAAGSQVQLVQSGKPTSVGSCGRFQRSNRGCRSQQFRYRVPASCGTESGPGQYLRARY